MKVYETMNSGIKIVEYEPSLAPGLAEFWNICGQEEDGDWGGESGVITPARVIAEHEQASFFNVYIALDGDTVVGYCSFGRYFADANTLYVALLGVRPDYRSKKIGKALVLRCVERTIELGYPRLDLFTWSGNTAAVPLYKKCGFLWEDRPDGTHLANFMPTILTTPLFEPFFQKADWYADSTRSLEIMPDGVKENGFEFFGYSWEKDGEMLDIGYERSGRQMRFIETNDYRIELKTPAHELAFGIDYPCTFAIENKSGKELNVKINGRTDGNITLNCTDNHQAIQGTLEIPAKFYVGSIDEPLHSWKVHPCLLADVEINGQTVTFGLGINAKFPLVVNINREVTVDHVGLGVTAHISFESALPEDARVTVSFPKNEIMDIKGAGQFAVDITAKGRASVKTVATTLAIGYEKLELDCTATFKSGEEMKFRVPAFLVTRDMTTAFYAESLSDRCIINGPWELTIDSLDNELSITHLTNKGFESHGAFDPPKLGKPYDDEFNLIKPNLSSRLDAGAIILEAEYVSVKFPGLVVTQVYTLHGTGLLTRNSIVENRGDKPRTAMLQDSYGFELSFNSIFSYKGQITKNNERTNGGGTAEGFQNVTGDDLDENWVFEDSPTALRGYCWPRDYSPTLEWYTNVIFEIDLGELAPGQAFVTKPVIYTLGLFANFNDLRNYALQIYNTTPAHTIQAMEVELNNYNPFVSSSGVKLDITNNRDEVQEGTITINCGSQAMSQTNPHEDIVECNSFDIALEPDSNIAVVDIKMDMVAYQKTSSKAVFFPSGEVTKTVDGKVYRVSNGSITFEADPNYGHGIFSMTDKKGQEWLFNQYPEHKPYSWFNPFLGGIRVRTEEMDDRSLLKEKITAEFIEKCDNFGNVWHGICTQLDVNEDEKHRGSVYRSYFLTLPGIPVLCCYYQFENGTGAYRGDRLWMSASLKPDEDAKNTIVEITERDGTKLRRRLGSVDTPEFFFEDTAVVTSSRSEKMYITGNSDSADYKNDFWGSNKLPIVSAFAHTHARVASGEVFTSNTTFFVMTDVKLPEGSLRDFRRVAF